MRAGIGPKARHPVGHGRCRVDSTPGLIPGSTPTKVSAGHALRSVSNASTVAGLHATTMSGHDRSFLPEGSSAQQVEIE
jgi:hypothetical protein